MPGLIVVLSRLLPGWIEQTTNLSGKLVFRPWFESSTSWIKFWNVIARLTCSVILFFEMFLCKKRKGILKHLIVSITWNLFHLGLGDEREHAFHFAVYLPNGINKKGIEIVHRKAGSYFHSMRSILEYSYVAVHQERCTSFLTYTATCWQYCELRTKP